MLDSLMGPGRDVVPKDKSSAKEKFKDRTVCKGYLLGLCPLDTSLLGGKRNFEICTKIHSDIMRQQLKEHAECESLTRDYEALSLQDLELVVRECQDHSALQRARISKDARTKKPALPPAVNDRSAAMKRESSLMVQQAEGMDDDKMREKEALITRAKEILKDRDDMLEAETKKAIEALEPEVVCEICGTAYIGEDGNAQHKKFRIHEAYVQIRDRIAELKPRVEEREKERRDKKDEERKKKRKEEWDKAAEKEKGKDAEKEKGKNGEKEDGDKKSNKDRGRSKSKKKNDGENEDGEKNSGKDDGEKKGGKDRSRSRRKRSASGDRAKAKGKERGRSRSRSRRRHDRSRGRGRDDTRGRRRAPSGSRSRSRRRGRR